MNLVRRLADGPGDESLRFATVAGLASIPFTIALSWDSFAFIVEADAVDATHLSADISGTAILLAGMVVGYVYAGRATGSRCAGKRTGVVGAFPLMALTAYGAVGVVVSESPRFGAIALVVSPVVMVLGAWVGGLFGTVGAIVGEWVRGRVGRGESVGSRS